MAGKMDAGRFHGEFEFDPWQLLHADIVQTEIDFAVGLDQRHFFDRRLQLDDREFLHADVWQTDINLAVGFDCGHFLYMDLVRPNIERTAYAAADVVVAHLIGRSGLMRRSR